MHLQKDGVGTLIIYGVERQSIRWQPQLTRGNEMDREIDGELIDFDRSSIGDISI